MSQLQETIQAVEQGLQTSPVFLQNAPPLQASLVERMAHYHVPGVSLAVINDGALEWAKGYGVTDIANSVPVTRATRFSAMSISKPVTALAVLRLVQQGVLDLDTNVNHYLQQWRVPENELTRATNVTLRHILSHTAGLDVGHYDGYAPDEPMPTLIELLNGESPANSGPIQVVTEPGTRYAYSGAGYWVVQQLLEEITGESFAVAMQQLVLEPLGMTYSAFCEPNGVAASAHDANGALIFDKWTRHPGWSDGGLWTTPTDLARYALEIMAAYNTATGCILDQPMAQAMLTPLAGFHGLGPFITGTGDALQFNHGGAGEGFLCRLVAFPRRGQGAVIMTNGANGWPLILELLRSLAQQYQWPHYQPIGKTRVSLDPARLAAYAGHYVVKCDPLMADRFVEYTGQWQVRDGRQVSYTIRAEDDHLIVQFPNDHELAFYPEAGETFFALENETVLNFPQSKAGAMPLLEIVISEELRLHAQRT